MQEPTYDPTDPLTYRALAIATHFHAGQVRKYTGEPYIVHPVEVAVMASQYAFRSEAHAAALLHDVVEDTDATIEFVRDKMGDRVADIVAGLTDVSRPNDGNRATRKAMDREHNARGNREVHIIKIADLISNTKTIVRHDPGFARKYLAEKALLLDVLTKAPGRLRDVAAAQLSAATIFLDASDAFEKSINGD